MRTKIRKKDKIVNEQTLLVTVDIGKFKNVGYLRCPDGTELMPFEFCNHMRGFMTFYRNIQWMKNQKQLTRVVIGVESTGPYAQPLLNFLKHKRVKLIQVNTYHTKRVKEIYDNSPNKTDYKDPQVMADIIELGRYLTVIIPEGVIATLRELIHNRESHVHDIKTLINRLNSQVYRIFPEFEQVMKNLKTKTSRYLLQHYADPETIVQIGLEKLTEVIRQQSRGKIKLERIEKLYKAATNTIGIKSGKEAVLANIESILEQMELLQRYINECELKISEGVAQVPYSRLITTIKGIGTLSAAVIISEVGDFRKFTKYEELEKLAGLNLFEISSGIRKGQKRISKRGRHLLRTYLFFAALRMIRKNGIFYDKYQQYIKRGMPGVKAVVAISRKLLRMIFAIVRDHKEFNQDQLKSSVLLKAA